MNKICYFSHADNNKKWNKFVFAFDTESNEVMDPIDLSQTLDGINFRRSTRMVQCMESLFFANIDRGHTRLYKVDQI